MLAGHRSSAQRACTTTGMETGSGSESVAVRAADDGVGVHGLGVGGVIVASLALGGLFGREEGGPASGGQAAEDAGLDKGAGVVVAVEAEAGNQSGRQLQLTLQVSLCDCVRCQVGPKTMVPY